MGDSKGAVATGLGTASLRAVVLAFRLAFPDMIVPLGWALALLAAGIAGILVTIVLAVRVYFPRPLNISQGIAQMVPALGSEPDQPDPEITAALQVRAVRVTSGLPSLHRLHLIFDGFNHYPVPLILERVRGQTMYAQTADATSWSILSRPTDTGEQRLINSNDDFRVPFFQPLTLKDIEAFDAIWAEGRSVFLNLSKLDLHAEAQNDRNRWAPLPIWHGIELLMAGGKLISQPVDLPNYRNG